jgi:plastocyanin
LLLFTALPILTGFAVSDKSANSKTHTITIHGMQFIPASLEVNAGDTVTWKNEDIVPHTATADTKRFDSGAINGGMSWKYVTRNKGSYSYICLYHPTMKAMLVVQ